MGMFTLTDYRNLLSTAIGDRGIGNERLDLWITLAYVEVMTHLDHAALLTCAHTKTVDGEASYSLPSELLGIDTILDHTTARTLIRTEIDNLKSFDKAESGAPKLWARLGSGFTLWPVPDGVFDLEAVYFKEAARMVLPEDKSILPTTWDNAIHLLSVHYALASLREPSPIPETWFQRAHAYMRSRYTEDDYGRGSLSMPVTVVKSFEEMMEHRKYL